MSAEQDESKTMEVSESDTKTPPSATAINELSAMRDSLQAAGLTLLKAATAVISAAANEVNSATRAVIETADETVTAAEQKIRKLRAELFKGE